MKVAGVLILFGGRGHEHGSLAGSANNADREQDIVQNVDGSMQVYNTKQQFTILHVSE